MKVYAWPRIPLLIALVLGPGFERNLHLAAQLQQLGQINFWRRPLVISLLVFSLVTLALPLVQNRSWRKTRDVES
jgi:putative tricarboxylic transport membrane protein